MHSHSWSDAGRRGWRWQVSVVLVMVMTLLVGMVVLVMMMAGLADSDVWWCGDSWNDGDGVEFDGWWFEEFTCMLVLLVALCDNNCEYLYYTLYPC